MARAYELDSSYEKIKTSVLLLKHQNQLSGIDSFILLGTMLACMNQFKTTQELYNKA